MTSDRSIPALLRHRCGHDSNSVEGCLDCEAADCIDRKARATAPTLDAWADLKFVQRVLEGNQRTADDEAALTIVKTLRNMVWDKARATAEPVAQSIQSLLDDAILAQGQIGRLQTIIREHEETIRQLVRAHREATEGETFMGEPVLPVRAPAASADEPVAWVDERDLAEGQQSFMACSDDHYKCHSNLRYSTPLFRAPAASVAPEPTAEWKIGQKVRIEGEVGTIGRLDFEKQWAWVSWPDPRFAGLHGSGWRAFTSFAALSGEQAKDGT